MNEKEKKLNELDEIYNNQDSLFEVKEWWEEHWEGMPQFIQEDMKPFHTIMVHFKNQEDMKKFSEFMKQPITELTKYTWYPKKKIVSYKNKLYVDENES